MVEKSKEFLATFDPYGTEKQKIKYHYDNFIKNRDNNTLLIYGVDGHLNKLSKDRIIAIHENKCVICGTHNRNKLEIHHVVPKSKGGTNEIGNLIPLCHICHCAVHKIDNLNPYQIAMMKRILNQVGEIA